MADIFGGAGTDGTAMNTTNVLNTGEDVCKYSSDLSTLLGEFDLIMSSLTEEQMKGYMSGSAFRAYGKVKESLDDYATQIGAVGLSIQSSAENMATAAQQSGDSIFAG